MQIDAVFLVELIYDAPKFYPLSLTTPLPLVICGGLRLAEQAYLRTRDSAENEDVELVQVVRPHLAVDWERIIPGLLLRDILNVDLRLITVSYRDLERVLSRYDNAVILPATALPSTKDVDVCKARLKDLGTRDLLDLAEKYRGRKIETICDLLRDNASLLEETLRMLQCDKCLVVESEVDQGVKVEKPCVLYRCTVRPFTIVRAGTVAYPHSVIGGEVKNSIIDVYSHKEHHGYLGDSYVGRFANLGAGTTTSNLKNTRGTIKYLGLDTGIRKLGSVIGDFVKTSVGTYIYSGKCVGPYSHVYHVVDIDVPPCTIYRGGRRARMILEKLLQFIERDCARYLVDVELEKKIAVRVYWGTRILYESSLQDLAFKLK